MKRAAKVTPSETRAEPGLYRRSACWPSPVMGVALFALVAACSGGELSGGISPKAQPVPVEVAEVRVRPMSDVLELVGTLEADESVLLHSEITGVVKAILFEEGDQVTAGTLLIRLDDSEQRARLRESEAQRVFARLDYARKQELAKDGAISTAELDRARASLRQLEAEVDALRARLEKTEIKAPFDGVLGARQVSPGDRVQRDDPLVNLQAVGRLKVLFTLPEPAAQVARPGQKVTVRVSAFPGKAFAGQVYFVSPSLDAESRRLLVKAYVPNSERQLKPGMFAEVELAVRESAAALAVPEAAVVSEAGSSFVYLVAEGKAQRVPVELGTQADGFVEITGKLKEGDLVVSAGVQKLSPGIPVAASDRQPGGAVRQSGDSTGRGT